MSERRRLKQPASRRQRQSQYNNRKKEKRLPKDSVKIRLCRVHVGLYAAGMSSLL